MALPLDPVTSDEMFPDTYVDPFVLSDDVALFARAVVHEWDEFAVLRDALRSEARPLEIFYVLDTKKFDATTEDWTIHTVVKVTKASPLWRSLALCDVVVAYRQAFWDSHDEGQRKAFLHHALSHIDITAGKVTLRDHPAEGFPWTLRRYGPLSFGETQFVRAGSLWNEDHPQEPTPLRAVDLDKVMDEVVDRVNAGELGPNVTASRGERLACVGSNHVPGCEHTGDVPKRGTKGFSDEAGKKALDELNRDLDGD